MLLLFLLFLLILQPPVECPLNLRYLGRCVANPREVARTGRTVGKTVARTVRTVGKTIARTVGKTVARTVAEITGSIKLL
jgi:hypothetical protein